MDDQTIFRLVKKIRIINEAIKTALGVAFIGWVVSFIVRSMPQSAFASTGFSNMFILWIVFGVIFIGMLLLTISRVNKVTADPMYVGQPTSPIQVAPEEQVQMTVAPIHAVPPGFRVTGIEIAGAGKENYPYLGLIVTDRQIIFTTLPLAGAGKIMAGTSLSDTYFWWMPHFTQQYLEKRLQESGLGAVVNSGTINLAIPLSDIVRVAKAPALWHGRFMVQTGEGRWWVEVRGKGKSNTLVNTLKNYEHR